MKQRWIKQLLRVVYVFFVVCFILVSTGFWGSFAMSYWQNNEPVTKEKHTNTEALHNLTALQASLFQYPILRTTWKHMQTEEESGTIVIPGLKVTETMRAGTNDVCTNMVPQSICVVQNYLLIGAYCHTGTHYSVIYVLNKNSGEYLKTIVLKGRHHVGGIAYDWIHERIWVSCYDKRAQANAFTLKQLKNYNYSLSRRPIGFTEIEDLYTIPRDSFMTYYENHLYIGYFQVGNNSILQKFAINQNGALKKVNSARYEQTYGQQLPQKIAVPVNVARISSKVQGITFTAYRMYVTESYGIFPSKLAKFSILPDDTEDPDYTNENAINIIDLPQKLEQITVDEGQMYSIYESGSYAYRYYSFPSIDRVIRMRMSDVDDFGR